MTCEVFIYKEMSSYLNQKENKYVYKNKQTETKFSFMPYRATHEGLRKRKRCSGLPQTLF